jgi:hypothetical protein
MNNEQALTMPLTPADRVILNKLKIKAWAVLLRLYIPLSLMLVYVYFKMQPGGTFRGHTLSYSVGQFSTVYPLFAAFFALLFFGFFFKDFRRLILPFIKEAKMNKKVCCSFLARKYHDPLYDKRLLFYPGKENVYIEVSPEDFDATSNGQELALEVAAVTGEVLALKCGERVFKEPEEFSFSDV